MNVATWFLGHKAWAGISGIVGLLGLIFAFIQFFPTEDKTIIKADSNINEHADKVNIEPALENEQIPSVVSEYGFDFHQPECSFTANKVNCSLKIENKSQQTDLKVEDYYYLGGTSRGYTRIYDDRGRAFNVMNISIFDVNSPKGVNYTYLPNIPVEVNLQFPIDSGKSKSIAKLDLRILAKQRGGVNLIEFLNVKIK